MFLTQSTKRFSPLLSPSLLLGILLGAGAALAQAGPGVLQDGSVSGVEIAVWRPGDKQELAQLSLGDTLVLDVGEEVMLRLYAPRGKGPRSQRNYLPARFVAPRGNDLRLSEVNTDKGSCTLTALRATGGRAIELRYDLSDRIQVTRPYLAKGTFQVKVERSSPSSPPSYGGHTSPDEIVARFFRGILLREPGPGGQGHGERVAHGGYRGVIETAYYIADSRESRDVVGNDHSVTERLRAIYRYLLDADSSEVDRYQLRDHTQMLQEGDVTGVVMDIVRGVEFRRLHGYPIYGPRWSRADRGR